MWLMASAGTKTAWGLKALMAAMRLSIHPNPILQRDYEDSTLQLIKGMQSAAALDRLQTAITPEARRQQTTTTTTSRDEISALTDELAEAAARVG
jgi:hypothetical protein